jgi:hypothetical protein
MTGNANPHRPAARSGSPARLGKVAEGRMGCAPLPPAPSGLYGRRGALATDASLLSAPHPALRATFPHKGGRK